MKNKNTNKKYNCHIWDTLVSIYHKILLNFCYFKMSFNQIKNLMQIILKFLTNYSFIVLLLTFFIAVLTKDITVLSSTIETTFCEDGPDHITNSIAAARSRAAASRAAVFDGLSYFLDQGLHLSVLVITFYEKSFAMQVIVFFYEALFVTDASVNIIKPIPFFLFMFLIVYLTFTFLNSTFFARFINRNSTIFSTLKQKSQFLNPLRKFILIGFTTFVSIPVRILREKLVIFYIIAIVSIFITVFCDPLVFVFFISYWNFLIFIKALPFAIAYKNSKTFQNVVNYILFNNDEEFAKIYFNDFWGDFIFFSY